MANDADKFLPSLLGDPNEKGIVSHILQCTTKYLTLRQSGPNSILGKYYPLY